MNKVQQNNLDKAMEAVRLLGFEDNLKDFDQSIIEDMKKRKLHPFTVIETKNNGVVVFVDYLYISEADDLVSIVSFIDFLNNLKDGECYSNCISDMNYGEGELGLIGIERHNGIWRRAW